MNAEQIIYAKLMHVWMNADHISITDLSRMAYNAANEIREEFKKAGVDVWKGGET